MSEYRNIYVMRGVRSYRVTFHVGLEKVMLVGRRTPRGGETYLDIDGPTARKVIKAARLKLKDSP